MRGRTVSSIVNLMQHRMEKAESSVPPAEPNFEDERKFFRCPACGENVDSINTSEVVEHHRHVLHPALYPFVRKTANVIIAGTGYPTGYHPASAARTNFRPSDKLSSSTLNKRRVSDEKR
jgi:hypothetical protein